MLAISASRPFDVTGQWGRMRVSFTRRSCGLYCCAVTAVLCSSLLSVQVFANSTPPRAVLIPNEVGLARQASAVITRELMSQLEGNRDLGLSENALTAGSLELNREPSLLDHTKWLLLPAVLVLLMLGSLTAYFLYERKQLIQARREQVRLSRTLIKAQEDERRRLAFEIHDDFSQRLALLSLGLETAAELVIEAPEKARQQLRQLVESAGELGADLHTLSHRLHSSTLERLGLVLGVGAFCKEFTAQQGVEVLFSHRNVPLSVPTEIALCLFRLVQEGLRNVKKHSGATKAKVALEQLNGQLHLSISDEGTGFNRKDVLGKQGIGMCSMEERARLIGAQFQIHSERDKGTQIDIWVRVAKQEPAKTADEVVIKSAVSTA